MDYRRAERAVSQPEETHLNHRAHALNELFSFQYNPNLDQLLLIPVTDQEISLLKVGDESSVLLVDDSESRKDAFSIVHPSRDRWLILNQDNTFRWTQQCEDRAMFHRAAKIADNEGQVGELFPGEVALYEHQGYRGRVWILSDSDKDRAGNYTHFTDFQDLNDRITSIRLGPDTGVTVFANENQTASEARRETNVEDFVDNVPDLRNGKAQIGNDTISSLKIFRTVAPGKIFTSVTSKLSQDYRMVGDKLEEFSSYRTILRFAPNAGEVEVSATDLTTIEVEGALHEIDEVRSVTLSPNLLNRIMITSEADGLSTPALKFRTAAMAENERIVIFPDREAHQQIAALEDDALWNATDAQGNLIIDRNAHTQSEVASVQNTIKRVMATTAPTDDTPATDADVFERNGLGRTVSKSRVVVSNQTSQVVSGEALGDPWTLHFAPRPSTIPDGSAGLVMPSDSIGEEPVNQNDFAQRLAQVVGDGSADSVPAAAGTLGPVASLRIGGFFGGIGDALKDAASVTIGFANDAMQVLVDIGGQIVRFVLDTAKKVADFVQAVVEKVVESIKQFIEFLQFLFDWDDILATQRFMVKTINSAFDSAEELVDSAGGVVSEFVDGLQKGLEDGINSLIRQLGVDPEKAKAEDSEGGLPEAAEWFLNKLLGGSKNADNDAALQRSTDSDDESVGSALQQAVDHLLEALRDAVEIGFEIFEGLIDTIEAFIANPSRPELALVEILETIRDVGVKVLDLGEELILGLLDVIVAVIRLLQALLNAEIRIPLISELFKLLGAGKLTILNLASVLLAIPTTIIHKLMFGEAPFRDVLPPDLSGQDAAGQSIVSVQRSASLELSITEGNGQRTRRLVRGFGGLSLTADLINGIITAGLDAFSEQGDDEGAGTFLLEITSLLLSWTSWFGSFPASPDEPGGTLTPCIKTKSIIKTTSKSTWSG
jgi:hypothetical protein